MDRLKQVADSIGQAFSAYSRIQFRSSLIVQSLLVVGGAALAGIATAVELAHANAGYSIWFVISLVGAGLLALGGIYGALTGSDASAALEAARKAVDVAREGERAIERFSRDRQLVSDQLSRALHLYTAMDGMRGAIEQSLALAVPQHPEPIIRTCLSAACYDLLVAFNFTLQDTWSICVYMASPMKESGKETGRVTLRCVAHNRKIECDLDKARQWPEGVGIAGIAYSTGSEVVISDTGTPELQSLFASGGEVRDYDHERYRSVAAVPIRVGSNEKPWGVAVATSDRQQHFSSERTDGVSTIEPLRALAAMTALAVQASERRRAAHPSAPGAASPEVAAKSVEAAVEHIAVGAKAQLPPKH